MCQYGSIEAIVSAHFDLPALADFSRTEEQALHGSFLAPVEQAVNLVCYLFRRLPCAPAVVTAEACHTVRIVAPAVEIHHLSGHAQHQHLIALPVSHDGRIAVGIAERVAVALSRAACEQRLQSPCLAAIVTDALVQIDGTITDVVAAIAIVADGYQAAVATDCQCGYAIRHGVLEGFEQTDTLPVGSLYGECQTEYEEDGF